MLNSTQFVLTTQVKDKITVLGGQLIIQLVKKSFQLIPTGSIERFL